MPIFRGNHKTEGNPKKRQGVTFPEWFVVLNGCLPLVLLAYDARYHRLGPDPIRNALHTTGAIGLLLLIATLTVTPIRMWTGWSGVVLYRRSLGLVAFLYSLLHIGIFVAHDQAGNFAVAWREVINRRYLQVGAISFALLLPLAFTSTPAMMRTLGIHRWKQLHRFAYLATFLAVIHQYMQSKADTTNPLLFCIWLGILLLSRLVDKYRKALPPRPKSVL